MSGKSIGIFDSGIGGLTVARAIWEKLPRENLIYLGDTARVPYGTRGREVICRFALELVKFLLKRQVKVLVVACNTISSTCLEEIKNLTTVPVIDAIDPVVEEAVNLTKNKVIGVIGTRATIGSQAYEEKIKTLDPKIKVLAASCPLFVPIAEEGLAEHQVAYLMAREYLKVFSPTAIDTLILGCTHYPILKKAIKKVIGGKVNIIDSTAPIAEAVKKLLQENGLSNNNPRPSYELLVTDAPEKIQQVAERFFGGPLPAKVKKVSLEDSLII